MSGHVPAEVVLCYPSLLIRNLAYKDTKMLVPAVSLYPRFTGILLIYLHASRHGACVLLKLEFAGSNSGRAQVYFLHANVLLYYYEHLYYLT
jgi:hypothetical protein